MAAIDLQAVASEYLAACEQAVATAPGGAITRSYISPGIPSFDCPPELSVFVGGMTEGITKPVAPPLALGQRENITGSVNLVPLTCVVTRCIPTVASDGTFPTAAAIEAAAVETNGDLWAIWNVVPALYRAGLIFTRPDAEQLLLFFDPAAALAIGGGVGGWAISILVEIDGYRPTVTP